MIYMLCRSNGISYFISSKFADSFVRTLHYFFFAFFHSDITLLVLNVLGTYISFLFVLLWLLVVILSIILRVSIPPYDYDNDNDEDGDWYRQD